MDECRRRIAEQLPQINLPRRRAQQVGAPQHPIDLHRRIIDHDSQLIGIYPVGAADHEIAAALAQLLALRSKLLIGKRNISLAGPKPVGRLTPDRQFFCLFSR